MRVGLQMEKVVTFLQEVRQELQKVTWPTFREFVDATTVALIVIALFAIYFGIIDYGIGYIAEHFVFRQ